MALKITRAADPITVERINVCLYGPPGIGKTSLAFTAEAPLLLDFDRGSHRAANRKDVVRVEAWGDVADMGTDDLAPYKTVIVDTAGRALDVLTADILRRDPKAGRGGALSLQGYGKLKAEFVAWLKALNAHGKDVILIAHMDEQRSGDDIIERLDVQGGSKGEIYKAADAMGRIAIRNNVRRLDFSPTDAAFGKNPANLDPLDIPHPDREPAFLAEVIGSIKTKLNEATEEQRKAQAELEGWRTRIDALTNAASFNECMPDLKTAPKAAQAMFAAAARAKGLKSNKEAGRYEDAPEPVAA